MAKIFSWDEVRCRNIPIPESFTRIQELLAREVQGVSAIRSMLFFGSVVRNEHTNRSDFDCHVIYETHKSSDAFAFMQSMAGIAMQLRVPLSFIPCDSQTAATRMHHFGPSFQKHLRRSEAKGLAKGNPFELLATSTSIPEEVDGYLRVKYYNLQAKFAIFNTLSDEGQAEFLSKIAQAPTHVARKVLDRFGVLDGECKSQVYEEYEALVEQRGHPLLAQALRSIKAYDKRYDEVVKHQLRRPNHDTYSRCIADLTRKQVPQVLQFLRENVLMVGQL